MIDIKHDDWIQTYTGKKFFVINPTTDMIDIRDIAHALSMNCRFAGHIKKFYSVAEHSINVSLICKPENKLCGLLHDASEAYIADIASPIKPFLTNYKEIENNIMHVIAKKFGFEWPVSDDVKEADTKQLTTEAINLLNIRPDWAYEERYATPNKPFGIYPEGFPPEVAEKYFLDQYENIIGGSV